MSSCTPAAKKVLEGLMAEKGNSRCIDCGSKLSVDWASVNLGVFFCIDCSGRHRSFGVHISFVRSITMDKWDDRQLAFMQAGGNKACKDFLKQHDCYDLPQAQRWASKGAEKWRQRLQAIVEGDAKRKPKAVSSSSESDSESSSDSASSSEDDMPVPPKKKEAPRPAKKPPAQKTQVVGNLIDLDAGPDALDGFFSMDSKQEPEPAAGETKRMKGKEARDRKKGRARKESQSSEEDEGRGRKVKSESRTKNKSADELATAMDNASLDERIQARKAQADKKRAAEAIAKLEAICGGGGVDEQSWGNVNPPGKPAVSSGSDSDSDAERVRQEKRQAAKDKEKRKAAKAAAKAAAAGGGTESTMQRLRREAAEEKARKERERQEHMDQFKGKAAISSSEYFGGDDGQSPSTVREKKDYSAALDGYQGDAPLSHAILHKGVLAKETLAIAKDRFAEVAPDVAGKAGKAAVAAASSAASYFKDNASGWLASAAQKVGVGSNSMSASSGSWIDNEARRRAELSKNSGKDLTKSGGFGEGSKGGMQGFGSENMGGGSGARSGGFGVIGKGGGQGSTPSVSALALDNRDLDRWLDSDDESGRDDKVKSKKKSKGLPPKDFFASSGTESDDEPKKKKKTKGVKKEKRSKKSSKNKSDASGDEAGSRKEKVPESVNLIDLLS